VKEKKKMAKKQWHKTSTLAKHNAFRHGDWRSGMRCVARIVLARTHGAYMLPMPFALV